MRATLRKYDDLIVLCAITLVVAVYSPLNPLTVKGITTDQAVFFTIAKGILNGKLAYVDFFDHKGILLYLILAAGLWFSESLIGNFVIEWIVIFLSAFFMYRIARLFAGKWISLLAVAVVFASDITLFTSSNSEEYIFPILCISVYLFLLQIRNKIKLYQVFLIGAGGMLVFFIKYNYCLIWAALGILLFLSMLLKRSRFVEIVKMCLAFGGGMLAATIPFALYLFATGSFGAFMDTYVLYSLHYAEFTGAAARVNCIRFLLDTPVSVFFYAAALLCVVLVIYIWFKKESPLPEIDKKQAEMSVYFMILSAAILVVTSSPGQSWYYYKQATMLIYIVPLALIVNVIYGWVCRKLPGEKISSEKAPDENLPDGKTQEGKTRGKRLYSLICGGVLTLLVLFSIRNRLTPEQYRIVQDERFVGAMKMCELIDEYCGGEDTMISFSNDCTMYFYSDCETASRIFFPSATIVEDELIDELMGDLERNKPKIITYQRDWEAGLSERMKEEACSFTEADYSLVYEDEYRSMYLRKE